MNLGVMSPILSKLSLDEMFEYLSSLGVQSLELGCGGSPGKAHCDGADFLIHPEKIEHLKDLQKKYNVKVEALCCHGNNVHPNKEIARVAEEEFDAAVLLAEKLGVKTVVTFSGCPGDYENAKYPNWVTCTWPNDYKDILKWQWEEVLIPYWQKKASFLKEHNVRVAFEMHPGFMVYNPTTMLRIREAVGDSVGCNFDPSHLFWQGINPVSAIHALEGCIYHFHAKDTYINPLISDVKGVLDTSAFGNDKNRSWDFRTVGYGHDEKVWKDMISALMATSYDGMISIEHEDPLMSPKEGLEKAVSFLKNIVIFENPNQNW